jgi:hypothetical protein
MSVSVGPGWTLFTVICRGARAMPLTIVPTAALVIAQTRLPWAPVPTAELLPIVTTRPAVVHSGDGGLDGEEDAAHVCVERQVEILERAYCAASVKAA